MPFLADSKSRRISAWICRHKTHQNSRLACGLLQSQNPHLCQALQKREELEELPLWKMQLLQMTQLKCKAEIQAVNDADPEFLLHSYLPWKLHSGSWI